MRSSVAFLGAACLFACTGNVYEIGRYPRYVDFDSATLIELPLSYERRGETSYWYEAPTVAYQGLLAIASNGFVQSYPGLWRLVG